MNKSQVFWRAVRLLADDGLKGRNDDGSRDEDGNGGVQAIWPGNNHLEGNQPQVPRVGYSRITQFHLFCVRVCVCPISFLNHQAKRKKKSERRLEQELKDKALETKELLDELNDPAEFT